MDADLRDPVMLRLLLASLRCALGYHEDAVRDRDAVGRQVLRCSRCWRVRGYVAVDPEKLHTLRAGQRAQAEALARRFPRKTRALRLIR